MLEVKVALVEVLRKMKFVRLDDTPVTRIGHLFVCKNQSDWISN